MPNYINDINIENYWGKTCQSVKFLISDKLSIDISKLFLINVIFNQPLC